MILGKKVLALIPARGGSKGLPGKNIKNLCGKPLIAWSIDSAKRSQHIDRVCVSTDSEEIATISRKFGAEVPFLRPQEISGDTASSVDVALHALDFYKNIHGEDFEYLVLLEPTSPLRKDCDIDQMIEKLSLMPSFTSIVSLGEVSNHPYVMKTINGEKIVDLIETGLSRSRRQDLPSAYFPFGVGYIVSVEAFRKEKAFHTKDCTYYKLERFQCFEIDDIWDFLCVENILDYKINKRQS
jgi:CMP-N-acetylneuraminic acid synthetase